MSKPFGSFERYGASLSVSIGARVKELAAARRILGSSDALSRLWGRDGSLWKDDLRSIQLAQRRLGWLDLPDTMPIEVSRLQALSEEVTRAGLRRVVVLGMGGSSLIAEALAALFPDAEGQAVTLLDSTVSAQIQRVQAQAPLNETLFVVASKSGRKLEPMALYAYFRDQVRAAVREEGAWRSHFIAITDAGSPLAELAEAEDLRACYLNPPDVGGRYAALSLFGLVPGALLGLDLDELLARARRMARACRESDAPAQNPGLVLGAILGGPAAGESPRDKVTLVTSPELSGFGPWVEQLLAESTGKQGVGILPVLSEDVDSLAIAADQRLYVYLRMESSSDLSLDAHMEAVAAKGHPVVVLHLADRYDVGAELFRWEFATAIAGKVLGINPFDQPGVDAPQAETLAELGRYARPDEGEGASLDGEPPAVPSLDLTPSGRDDTIALYGPPGAGHGSVAEQLTSFLRQAQPEDYVAILAYVDRNKAHETALGALRQTISARLGVVVTLGYGPRYLHSTGQLHKDGRDSGLYLQLTTPCRNELDIPERPYDFGQLLAAQALGDRVVLMAKGRRVMRAELLAGATDGVQALSELMRASL